MVVIEIDITEELLKMIISCCIFEQDVGDYHTEFIELVERIVEQNEDAKNLVIQLHKEEDKRLDKL